MVFKTATAKERTSSLGLQVQDQGPGINPQSNTTPAQSVPKPSRKIQLPKPKFQLI